MTAFKVLVDFARSHLKLSQTDLADLVDVDVTDIKNWNRRGFPERSSKEIFLVEIICDELFFKPSSIYETSDEIITSFICYIQRYGYFNDIDSKKKFTRSEFCLFINNFLLIDSSKKKKIPNTENSS